MSMLSLEELEVLTAAALEEGDLASAERLAWQQLDIDKLHEPAYRQLMITLAKSGRRSAALAQYEIYRKRLDEKSSLQPAAEITKLYRRIQADELRQTMIRRPQALPPETATINPIFCYTDIESSTRLWDEHREAMLDALLLHNDLAEREIERFGSRILHPTGDGFLIVFEQNDPLQFAISLQNRFAEAEWGEIGELRIRIGLHGATADQEGHDFFREGEWYRGSVLNHAARIADTGHGGQIVASDMVKEYCPLPSGATWQDLGQHSLKSLDDTQHIFGLLHPDLKRQSFPPLRTPANKQATAQSKGRIRGYDLGHKIGQGAFGVVHRAYQPTVGREVAIKIILPQYANHPDFIRRFEAEAQTVARLEHPHIVPLYDYWREPDGAFLVMRWLRGGSLQSSLVNGPWEPGAAVQLVDQIAGALASAHRQGMVHRDIKPANILLDEEGNAYLSDFGIAKDVTLDAGLTETGAIVGSPAYISPEQALNEEITPLTDIYSLGIVLYELLTSRHPFPDAHLGALMMKHINEPLPSLCEQRPELPDALDEVIQQATAKNPTDRYVDALAVAVAFREATSGLEEIKIIPAADLVNPYKGLRSFREADADDFFGREALTQELLERLNPRSPNGDGRGLAPEKHGRFLAVVGPSGSGKSSVVKAGVVPALRQGAVDGSQNWFIVQMMPGSHPFEELEAGLLRIAVNPPSTLLDQLQQNSRGTIRAVKRVLPGDEDSELMLIVDQFEELFTLVEDKEEQQLFLDSLLEVALDPRSRVRVILTLRADFYDRPLSYPDFGELVRQHTTAIVPLTNDELGRAICAPAERAGAKVAPELLASIINDVSQQPGALPLLQYALTELFERRQGRTMTLAAYEEMGGVMGALGRRAEEIYQSLDESEQEATRQLFLRLVTLGEGVEDTRRRVLRSELEALNPASVETAVPNPQPPATAAQLDPAIDAFGRYRLLTFDHDPATRGPTVEVAHEALLREWDRLRGWLDESRDDVRWQRRLAAAASEWLQSGRDDGFLLHGSRLEQFDGWAATAKIALTQDERGYLEASVKAREAREAEEEERRRRELETAQQLAQEQTQRAEEQSRSARRLRRGALLLAGVSLLSLVLAAAALIAWANATRESAVNRSLVLANSAVEATKGGEVDQGLALALAAVDMNDPPPDALRDLALVANSIGTRAVLMGHNGPVRAADFSPDGRQAVSGGCVQVGDDGRCSAGEMILWDLQTMSEAARWPGHEGWVAGLAWRPGSDEILSAGEDGRLILWDTENQKSSAEWEIGSKAIASLAISPDGETAVAGDDDGVLTLLDLSQGKIIQRLEGHDGAVTDLAFSPDGRQILSGSADTTMILWDAATGEALQTFTGSDSAVVGVAFLPAGDAVLSTGGYTIRQWEAATGEELRRRKMGDSTEKIAVAPDGHTVFHVSSPAMYTWDLDEWQAPHRKLFGHDDIIHQLQFSADGSLVLSASEDGTVRIWNLERSDEVQLIDMGLSATGVAVAPDGNKLALGGWGEGHVIWDLAQGQVEQELIGGMSTIPPGGIAYSPDGRWIAASTGEWEQETEESRTMVWDAETGSVKCILEGHERRSRTVAFTPDSRQLLSGSQGEDNTGDIVLWDAHECRLVRRFETVEDTTGIDFSDDGRYAFTSSAFYEDSTLWDMETGQMVRVFELPGEFLLDAAFGPDDKTVLTSSINNDIVQMDVETGQEVKRFSGHEGGVFSIALSPDERQLVSADDTGTIILWDVVTGKELRRHKAHKGSSFQAAFSPDGQTVYSAGTDGTLAVWQIGDSSLEALVDWIAENRYVRELTCLERAQYNVKPLCDV